MSSGKAMGLLGLALRAGQAVLGSDACRLLIRSGRCGLILLDGDTAENTRKKYEAVHESTGVPVSILPAGMIETATGKDNRVMALRKGAFAEQLKALLAPDERLDTQQD